MFNNITWHGYWLALAFLLACYYLVIYLLYFRNDFKINMAWRVGHKWTRINEIDSEQPTLFTDIHTTTLASGKDTGVDQLVPACTDELSAYFLEASRSKVTKKEMLFSLSKLLFKYPSLRTSEYAVSISNLIRSEAEYHCSIQISSEEVVEVWLGL